MPHRPPGLRRPPLLQEVAFDDPRVVPLLAALDADLTERYDSAGEVFPPHDPGSYVRPQGTFLLAELDAQPVGCGGLRPGPQPGTGEVKRMYVDPVARGRGTARALLAALVSAAVALGYERLVLETGTEQPEAIALYTSAGWQPIAQYGHYRDSPRSRCFALELPT